MTSLLCLAAAALAAATWTFDADVDGWRPRQATIALSHVEPGRDGGGGALRVTGASTEGWNYARSNSVPLEPGQLYRLTAWLRVDQRGPSAPWPYVKCEFIAADGASLGRLSTEPVGAPAGEWQQVSAEFAAPQGTDHGWLAIEKGTDQPAEIDLLLDDVRIDEIDRLTAEDRFALEPPGRLVAARGVHPRLFLTAQHVAQLRDAVTSTHRSIWERLRPTIDRLAGQAPPNYATATDHSGDEQLWQREVGNALPYLAIGWLVTREQRYLEAAARWAEASCGYPTWGLGRIDGLDLAAGHQMLGLAVVYDWCGADLPATTRDMVRTTLLTRGRRQFKAAALGEIWWMRSYLQNHQWISLTGLAAAGLALWDEEPETLRWVGLARATYAVVWRWLGPDGASHEGPGYWSYGVEYLLKYMELARDLLGDDLYDHPWWRNTAAYRLYSAVPRQAWTHRSSQMDLGDSPRSNWYGPDYLLRRLASEYRDGTAQWLADEIEASGTAAGGARWLGLLWYDPDLPAARPIDLPTLRHFEDLGLVSARSDWSGQESLVYLRCGPPLGHEATRTLRADAGSGHVHPDLGHFSLFGAGHWLLRDDGYRAKWTAGHNTLLIDGRGQLGEGAMWYQGQRFLGLAHQPRVLVADSTPQYDQISLEVGPGYPAEVGLTRFRRHLIFVKPQAVLVLDDIELARESDLELRFFPEDPPQATAEGCEVVGESYRMTVTSLTPGTTSRTETVRLPDAEGQPDDERWVLRLTRRARRWRQATAVVWSSTPTDDLGPCAVAAQDQRWVLTVDRRRLVWDWATERVLAQ